ncbi:MAG TPA: hypothetical protein VMM17_13125 [Gemmatimonadaceae bacterium]|nr:hypothetical protein [Gemmatimonadaceae bacterium]
MTFARSAQRGWGGGDTQERSCRGCAVGTSTDVQVDAVAGLTSYQPPPARIGSALVARFINRGSETEEKYGLPGGSLAPHYLVLDPGDGSDRVRWRVWSEQGNTVVQGDSGWFRLCHEDKAYHPGADRRVKFLDCPRTFDTPGGGESAGALLNSLTADVWLECGRAGCCSASVT